MTSNRFFIQKAKLNKPTVLLSGEEHHHLHSVVRIKSGEHVWLFDEQGTEYLACVIYTGRDNTRLSLINRRERKEHPVKVTLAPSLLKSGRFEFLLQKATEIGVDRLIPVITARAIVKIEAKIERKLERWQRIIREAAKQSGNTEVPKIMIPKPLREVLAQDKDDLKIFLNERGGVYLKEILFGDRSPRKLEKSHPSSVRVLIGPEGGWTEQEEHAILDHGYKAISLGEQTLRSETAAISCLILINHFWNL